MKLEILTLLKCRDENLTPLLSVREFLIVIAGQGGDIRQRARREEINGALQGDQRDYRRSSPDEPADVVRHHVLSLRTLVFRGK